MRLTEEQMSSFERELNNICETRTSFLSQENYIHQDIVSLDGYFKIENLGTLIDILTRIKQEIEK